MARLTDTFLGELISAAEAAVLLGVPRTRIKQLERENLLVVVRRDGTNYVPACLTEPLSEEEIAAEVAASVGDDDEPAEPPSHRLRPNLRGTLTLLADAGFSREEMVAWLWASNEELGESPINAIFGGHHHHVNRIAATLGL